MSDDRSMRDRMLAGDPYLADDPALNAERRRAAVLLETFNRSPASNPDDRRRVLSQLLGSFGEGSEIRAPLYCDYGYRTRIGARTFVNFGLVILDPGAVNIGDDVQIGPNVQLLTETRLSPSPAAKSWSSHDRSALETMPGWVAA